jgi:hypothetical protein
VSVNREVAAFRVQGARGGYVKLQRLESRERERVSRSRADVAFGGNTVRRDWATRGERCIR